MGSAIAGIVILFLVAPFVFVSWVKKEKRQKMKKKDILNGIRSSNKDDNVA